MSVIVKGMEMPECCAGCFAISDSLGWCKASGNDIYSPFSMDVRPSFCPLHPLPEKHGRLIDGNNVLDIVYEWCPDDDGSVGKMGDLREMLDEIEAIPTIVEAEGE